MNGELSREDLDGMTDEELYALLLIYSIECRQLKTRTEYIRAYLQYFYHKKSRKRVIKLHSIPLEPFELSPNPIKLESLSIEDISYKTDTNNELDKIDTPLINQGSDEPSNRAMFSKKRQCQLTELEQPPNGDISSMIGMRDYMEDRHVIATLRLTNRDEQLSMNTPESSIDVIIYGVFDGHGGKQTAELLQKELPGRIAEILSVSDLYDEEDIQSGFKEVFTSFDSYLYRKSQNRNWDDSGSTAIVSVKITLPSMIKIYLLNLGDSRGLLFDEDGTILIETSDQKPDTEEEKKRIEEAGGCVEYSRVDGDLAVSRAFGDFPYKINQTGDYDATTGKVSANPDIYLLEISSQRKEENKKKNSTEDSTEKKKIYGLLASDGLWDHYESDDVVKTVLEMMKNHQKVECDFLTNTAIKMGPSGDNTTAMFFKV